MLPRSNLFFLFILFAGFISCTPEDNKTLAKRTDSMIACENNLPARFAAPSDSLFTPDTKGSTEGMVWLNGGVFLMGATDNEGRPDEYPSHKVKVDGFWID